jgi:hypothetical protein
MIHAAIFTGGVLFRIEHKLGICRQLSEECLCVCRFRNDRFDKHLVSGIEFERDLIIGSSPAKKIRAMMRDRC